MEIQIKDIPGYEGIYKVSEFGVVYSLDRIVNSKGNNKRIEKGITISPSRCKKTGRSTVVLRKNNIRKGYGVSVLVAMAFIPNPLNLPIVEHNDDDCNNDHYSNLKWSTQSNNISNAYIRKVKKSGEEHCKSKLSEEEVLLIKESNKSQTQLAKEYNVAQTTIRKIKLNLSWKHV